jgi:hypothetical protein
VLVFVDGLSAFVGVELAADFPELAAQQLFSAFKLFAWVRNVHLLAFVYDNSEDNRTYFLGLSSGLRLKRLFLWFQAEPPLSST